MPTYRLQVSMGADTALPRDRFVITPHFSVDQVDLGAADADQLCQDLAEGLSAWITAGGTAQREINVRAYRVGGPPPHYPAGEHTVATGQFPASAYPRELAVCLSFYSGRNVGRQRGRLYVPVAVALAGNQNLGARPGATVSPHVADLVPIFTGLGGVNVDWSVYSRADGATRSVSNWFVDDEYDVQRRRGLRSSFRLTGATSE
jgi:hypothetical protein